ncbi:flagellar basal body P-ring formation chaperone FlgA [Pseudomonas sp. SWI44]|uniref:flagellar basal body P-ring formation chaperone FlgA n=1 Tax=Pseudomonas sp. SWI44 TaxID=2083053 RepID=UPI000CE5E080|nr:flagellar basal body P-ring formation chaperone FlgA [Pseudomonas sp. SWI44]AVD88267.1 flagella basal body P-ring formation protein FlgA [Pseudomonas sp. SWI44]
MKGFPSFHALLALACLAHASASLAQTEVLQARMQRLVEQNLPAGSRLTSLDIGQVSSRIAACDDPHPYLVHPRRLPIGRVAAGVRCGTLEGVAGYVQVMVGALGAYVVTARKIDAGEVIQAQMLISQRGPLEELPKGSALSSSELVGRQAARGVAKGSVVALKAVRERWLVEREKRVSLRALGAGFSLTRDGKALDNGSLGNTVRFKSSDGRMLNAQVVGKNQLLLQN